MRQSLALLVMTVLSTGACGWERTNPLDPKRCAAICGGGQVCIAGQCRLPDGGPTDGPARDTPVPDQGIDRQPDVAKPDLPKADLPKPDLPKPDLPKPDLPKPDLPKPDLPKPDLPKPDLPKPDLPKPDLPKPDLPAPDLAQPDTAPQDGTGPDAPPPVLWTTMSTPTTEHLRAIWGTSDSNVFAVGLNGTILHYNGSGWSKQTNPSNGHLFSVWGTSATNVYAAGQASFTPAQQNLVRYNGSTWSFVTGTGSASHLWGIHGTGPNDIWVGDSQGKVLHYGGSWSIATAGTTPAFISFWAFGTNDVWAVGYDAAVSHYTGTWTQQTTPAASILYGVWGTSSTNLYVVGGVGVYKREGTTWKTLTTPVPGGYAIWGTSADRIFVVSTNGQIMRFNGTTWSVEASGTTEHLYGVWASPTGRTYAVGDNGTILVRSPPGFVALPAGTFKMGSPPTELCRQPSSETLHDVTLTHAFELQTTEVTQAQFQALMGYNPSAFTACGADCPVEKVSWHEAAAYCNALSTQVGATPCYSCTGSGASVSCTVAAAYSASIYSCPGYRLPTEAEWEYVYRAGSSTAYYPSAGNDGSSSACATGISANADKIGWYRPNSAVAYAGCANMSSLGGPTCTGTHTVAQKAPNAWGFYDMAGNTWEWCHDHFQLDLGSSAASDPFGPGTGTQQVLRGGSWYDEASFLRGALRVAADTVGKDSYIGFRACRSK